jgi:hypothetical protein
LLPEAGNIGPSASKTGNLRTTGTRRVKKVTIRVAGRHHLATAGGKFLLAGQLRAPSTVLGRAPFSQPGAGLSKLAAARTAHGSAIDKANGVWDVVGPRLRRPGRRLR